MDYPYTLAWHAAEKIRFFVTLNEIGNLIQDTRDSITSITWTNAQKIDSIAKSDRSIWFRYDAMQNRVVKHSKPNGSDLEKRTYYIRDAQGNVMATYAAWVQNDDGAITWDSLKLSEQHIYGSARVGLALPGVKLFCPAWCSVSRTSLWFA